jgi:hypothetical protein
LLFEAAALVVAAGGGHFEASFEAHLTFLPRCVGVMLPGPLFVVMLDELGDMMIDEKQKHR